MFVKYLQDKVVKIDQSISYQIYSFGRKLSSNRKYLKALEYSCHGIPWLMIVTILFYISNTSSRLYAKLLIGLLFDIIYVAVLKSLSRRCRPTYSNQEDQMVLIGVDKLSFPSGHSSRAIYVALFFSEYWFSPLVWLWAIAVTVSRVLYGRHFLGDILGGIVVGYWNHITQFSLFYPIHAFMMWFLMNLNQTGDDYTEYLEY